ncbi:MAG: hypothetical protein IJZ50_04025 [Alistipes sp.]|nr:hypothetical protein [Alistipes sp.]
MKNSRKMAISWELLHFADRLFFVQQASDIGIFLNCSFGKRTFLAAVFIGKRSYFGMFLQENAPCVEKKYYICTNK